MGIIPEAAKRRHRLIEKIRVVRTDVEDKIIIF